MPTLEPLDHQPGVLRPGGASQANSAWDGVARKRGLIACCCAQFGA